MLSDKYSIYLGSETEDIFIGFIVNDGFYLVLKIESKISKEEGHEILKDISDSIKSHDIKGLDDFENYLASKWTQHNLPADFSYATGILKDKLLLLKTKGSGQIFIKKENDFAKIIEAENRASGDINPEDFFVITTKSFTDIIGGEESLGEIFDNKNPHEILEDITPKLKSQNDQGTIALFLTFEVKDQTVLEKAEEQTKSQYRDEILPKTSLVKDKVSRVRELLKVRLTDKLSKKPATIILALIISFFLIWSLISGYNRNTIKATEVIKEKLIQADEVSEINLSRAIALLAEAKNDLTNLKGALKNKSKSEIIELENLIKKYESKILKTEEKSSEEFYDLSVENKSAKIYEFSKHNDTVVILDIAGSAYILSLAGKSIDSRSSSNLKNSTEIAIFEDSVYFLKKDGVYNIGPDDKSAKVIKEDGWGDITDMAVFAGNIYLLDSKNSDIYKYIPVEDGFSSKKSYFKSGQSINLDNSNSISIDGSVFIGFPKSVVKYTSGLRDGFSTTYPNDNLKITKIYTDSDTEKVYAWSKEKGVVYVLSKTGSYEIQINSSILKSASDFVVHDNSIFAGQGSKIYKISLE